MTSSARDLRYGRRGGRWADTWTAQDEARYQQDLELHRTNRAAFDAEIASEPTAPPDLFTPQETDT